MAGFSGRRERGRRGRPGSGALRVIDEQGDGMERKPRHRDQIAADPVIDHPLFRQLQQSMIDRPYTWHPFRALFRHNCVNRVEEKMQKVRETSRSSTVPIHSGDFFDQYCVNRVEDEYKQCVRRVDDRASGIRPFFDNTA